MLKAYVGVASKHGLSLFQPEQEESLSRVRCSVRQSIRRFGFWAVVNDDEARSIATLVCNGQRHEAMMALDRLASQIGPLLPGDTKRPH